MTQAIDNKSKKTRDWSIVQFLFWGIFACVNIAFGFYLAIKPGKAADLRLIMSWVRQWVWNVGNPYLGPLGVASDYPPHALVFLSPLGLLSDSLVRYVWILLNLAIAPLVCIITMRLAYPAMPLRKCLLPVLMFLCWSSVRVGMGVGQMTLWVMFLGLVAIYLNQSKPILAGIVLGLSLLKPHVAVVYFLWMILNKKYKTIIVAISVVLLGNIIFFYRSPYAFTNVIELFVSVIKRTLFSSGCLYGNCEIRPLFHMILRNFLIADTLHWAVVSLGFAAIMIAAWRRTSMSNLSPEFSLLQIISLWSLMAIFHNLYDRVILLPVFAGLYISKYRGNAKEKNNIDNVLFWLFQLTLIMNINFIARNLPRYIDITDQHYGVIILTHYGRVFVAVYFVYFAYRLLRPTPIKIQNYICPGAGIRSMP